MLYTASAARTHSIGAHGGVRRAVVIHAARPTDAKASIGVAAESPDEAAPQRLRSMDELPCTLCGTLN